jgi:hypothetical protein
MKTCAWTTCLVFSLALSACDGGGGGGNLDPVPPEVAERACAALGACLGVSGVGSCTEMMDQLDTKPAADLSFLLGMNDDDDWIANLALALNAQCAADATTCEQVLQCLNGGEAERACTTPANSLNDRWCQDGDTLLDCSGVGLGTDRVQTQVSCGALGLRCLELTYGQGKIGICANGTSGNTGASLQVTCAGQVAVIQGFGASLRLDCGFYDRVCTPGTYVDPEDIAFCAAPGPACDEATFQDRCEGSRVVQCEDGLQAGMDCAPMGQTCGVIDPTWGDPYPTCVYGSCSPSGFPETCNEATSEISFCGPAGVSTLDCSALGYSACSLDGEQARCID